MWVYNIYSLSKKLKAIQIRTWQKVFQLQAQRAKIEIGSSSSQCSRRSSINSMLLSKKDNNGHIHLYYISFPYISSILIFGCVSAFIQHQQFDMFILIPIYKSVLMEVIMYSIQSDMHDACFGWMVEDEIYLYNYYIEMCINLVA